MVGLMADISASVIRMRRQRTVPLVLPPLRQTIDVLLRIPRGSQSQEEHLVTCRRTLRIRA